MAFPTMPRHPRADYIDPPATIHPPSPASSRGWFVGYPSCPPPSERTRIQIVRPSDGRLFHMAVDNRLAVLFGDFLRLAQIDGRFELRKAVEKSDNGRAQGGNGSFACRGIKAPGTVKPSNHSNGTAIDVWTRSNPQVRNGNFVSTIHPEVVELAAAGLIYWGGWYYDQDQTYADAMHFEFMGTPADVAGAIVSLDAMAEEIRKRKAPPTPQPPPSGPVVRTPRRPTGRRRELPTGH